MSLPPEEAARLDLYALLARLFNAGPDAPLLEAIVAQAAHFGTPGDAGASALGAAWKGLAEAARTHGAADATREYDGVFVGMGKAGVSLYASHYLTENWKELTLVNLRDELRRIGLARKPGVTEPEDHLSALLNVMGNLVQRSIAVDNLLEQQRFFVSYLAPWYGRFCIDLEANSELAFYKQAGDLLRAFLDLEAKSFELAPD